MSTGGNPHGITRKGFLAASGLTLAGLATGGVGEALAGATRGGAKKSPLVVYDWSYYQKDYTGFNAYFKKYGVPKYITFNTDQAELAKAASGAVQYDVVHPCIAYIPDWQAAGLIKPIDTSKLKTFKSIDKSLSKPGIVGGKVYGLPWDWGYSTLMYRGDKYKPKEQSWESLLFDKRLRNKITIYDEGVAVIKIGGLINGVDNPNRMTQAEIDKAAQTMIKAKPNIASFWQSETQAMQDFNSGKVWVTYAWPDTYAQVITNKAMKGVPVTYMQPKEGMLAWICAFAIGANVKNEDLAYKYLDVAYSTPSMEYLVNAFYTGGAAMTKQVLAKADPKFVKQFRLDQLSTALKPPRVWLEEHLPNRVAYLKAYQKVKSA